MGKLDKIRGTGLGGTLRSGGRVALWAVAVLIFFRGTAAVLGNSESEPSVGTQTLAAAAPSSQVAGAFAVRFVRAYLADSSPAGVSSLLAPGATVAGGGGPTPPEAHVAQAEASATREIGHGREIVTVVCELVNGQNFTLAVPIVRDQAGGVAALGAPAFVAAPGIARIEAEQSRPILGADAGAIRALASKFIDTYLASSGAASLEYLSTQGSELSPIGGLTAVGQVSVRQLGEGSGASRTVIASVRARSGANALYPLAYRLAIERDGGRWYVSAIEGEGR